MEGGFHVCNEDECPVGVYAKLKLDCRVCRNPIMISCMRERNESVTKAVLVSFGLGYFDEIGVFASCIEENIADVEAFRNAFSPDSPFGVICES